jgi:subtilisin family serine protease
MALESWEWAPGASIYAIKVLDGGGFGTASTVLSGIEWAVNNNMTIISMSLQSPDNNTAVFDAVNVAYNSGILLVAAGGNTGGGPVSYPAAYDSVIAVTAIDQNDQIASFSPNDTKIELAAPGVNINSTKCLSGQLPNTCLKEGYGILSGTSMAAPHVTGVAALIMSINFPDVNGDGKRDNQDVRLILQNTARHVGTPGRNSLYGFGVVDAQNATLGIPTSTPTPTTTPTPTPTPVPIDINLIRIKSTPIIASKTINMSQGNYSIIINNTNLSELAMIVYDNGTIRKDLSKKFIFNNWSDPNFPTSSNWSDPAVANLLDVSIVGYDNSKPNSNNIT